MSAPPLAACFSLSTASPLPLQLRQLAAAEAAVVRPAAANAPLPKIGPRIWFTCYGRAVQQTAGLRAPAAAAAARTPPWPVAAPRQLQHPQQQQQQQQRWPLARVLPAARRWTSRPRS